MPQPKKKTLQHRMTLPEIYKDYQDGLLSVKGALYYAVSATCPPGKPVNFNVSEFLEKTGIHRGSYARAVAELVKEGRLDFPPNSVQSLRIPAIPGTMLPSYYSLVTSRSQNCDERSQNCDERSQICDRTKQNCDRTKQNCDNEASELPIHADSEAPPIYLSNLPLSLSTGEREEDEGSGEYEEWLTRRALELPHPPTLIQEWIEKNKGKKSNKRQFLKYKEQRDRASVPQPAEAAIFEVESEEERRLGLLQFWWEDGSQERVKATIKAHPEWNLQIGQHGPEAISND